MKKAKIAQFALIFFCASSVPLLPALFPCEYCNSYNKKNVTTNYGKITSRHIEKYGIYAWKKALQGLKRRCRTKEDVREYLNDLRFKLDSACMTPLDARGPNFCSKLFTRNFITSTGIRGLYGNAAKEKLQPALYCLGTVSFLLAP